MTTHEARGHLRKGSFLYRRILCQRGQLLHTHVHIRAKSLCTCTHEGRGSFCVRHRRRGSHRSLLLCLLCQAFCKGLGGMGLGVKPAEAYALFDSWDSDAVGAISLSQLNNILRHGGRVRESSVFGRTDRPIGKS